MILARTSKPTLTPFGLNHNDTLRFTCRDGRGWDMTLLATSAAVLEREHAARRGYQDKGHDSGDISAYAFECDLRINGREEKRPVRVNPVSRKYGRSGSARPAPKQGAPAGLSGEAAWAKTDPRPRASVRDGPEHPTAVPEVPRHCRCRARSDVADHSRHGAAGAVASLRTNTTRSTQMAFFCSGLPCGNAGPSNLMLAQMS